MHKYTILIVDDEALNLKIVAQALQERYTIVVATNGELALHIVQKTIPDLILLDISMPNMDGFEVLMKIKDDPKTDKIPVIFLTADNTEETIVKAFNSGAVDYITKPFQMEELNVRVDNQIRTYSLQNSLNRSVEVNRHLMKIVDSYVSFIRVDTLGIIQEISTNFCNFLQCTSSEMIGKNINILKSGLTPSEQYQDLWNTISSGQTFVHEIQDRNFSGTTNWYRVNISPNYNDANVLEGYVAIYENIDDAIKFKKNAETDTLTSLPNRFKIDEMLILEQRRANRNEEGFSVILVDIDHFKEVNDTFGHKEGDYLLQAISTVMEKNIRISDFLGRWGGEEFLVICPNTDMHGAYTLAENLRMAVENFPFPTIGHKTASFGVAQYEKTENLEMLFARVDKALYAAKGGGRNQVQVIS